MEDTKIIFYIGTWFSQVLRYWKRLPKNEDKTQITNMVKGHIQILRDTLRRGGGRDSVMGLK